ncbi:MAG: D-galactonate dehydratase, partial [Methanobacteriota archaeon]
MSEGLTMVKVSPAGPMADVPDDGDLSGIVAVVSAVREAIGELKMAIDLHGRLSPAASRRLLPLLEPYDPCFVEEPCLPDGSAAHLRDL